MPEDPKNLNVTGLEGARNRQAAGEPLIKPIAHEEPVEAEGHQEFLRKYGALYDKVMVNLNRLKSSAENDRYNSRATPQYFTGLIARSSNVLEGGITAREQYIIAYGRHGGEHPDTESAHSKLQESWFALSNVLNAVKSVD